MKDFGQKERFTTREEALEFLHSQFETLGTDLKDLFVIVPSEPNELNQSMREHCLPDYQVKSFEGSFVIYRQVYYKQDAHKPKRRRDGIVTFYKIPADQMKARFIKSTFKLSDRGLYWCDVISFLCEKAIEGKWLQDFEHDTLSRLYETYRRNDLFRKHKKKRQEELRQYCLKNGIPTKAIEL